jgi:hypothetical protein
MAMNQLEQLEIQQSSNLQIISLVLTTLSGDPELEIISIKLQNGFIDQTMDGLDVLLPIPLFAL